MKKPCEVWRHGSNWGRTKNGVHHCEDPRIPTQEGHQVTQPETGVETTDRQQTGSVLAELSFRSSPTWELNLLHYAERSINVYNFCNSSKNVEVVTFWFLAQGSVCEPWAPFSVFPPLKSTDIWQSGVLWTRDGLQTPLILPTLLP